MGHGDSIALKDYYQLLEQHDWFYDYSDQHSTWERGHKNQQTLERAAKLSPVHQRLFDEFREHKFKHRPKPECPANAA